MFTSRCWGRQSRAGGTQERCRAYPGELGAGCVTPDKSMTNQFVFLSQKFSTNTCPIDHRALPVI